MVIAIKLMFILCLLVTTYFVCYESFYKDMSKNKVLTPFRGLIMCILFLMLKLIKMALIYMGLNFVFLNLGILDIQVYMIVSLVFAIIYFSKDSKILENVLNSRISQTIFFFFLRINNSLSAFPVFVTTFFYILIGFSLGCVSMALFQDPYFSISCVGLISTHFSLERLLIERLYTRNIEPQKCTGEILFEEQSTLLLYLIGVPLTKKVSPYFLRKNYNHLVMRRFSWYQRMETAGRTFGGAFKTWVKDNPEAAAGVAAAAGGLLLAGTQVQSEYMKRENDARVANSIIAAQKAKAEAEIERKALYEQQRRELLKKAQLDELKINQAENASKSKSWFFFSPLEESFSAKLETFFFSFFS